MYSFRFSISWQFEIGLRGRGIRWQEASLVMLRTCYPKTLFKQFNREKEKRVITYGNRIQQNLPTKLLFKTRNHLTDCFHSWKAHEGQPFSLMVQIYHTKRVFLGLPYEVCTNRENRLQIRWHDCYALVMPLQYLNKLHTTNLSHSFTFWIWFFGEFFFLSRGSYGFLHLLEDSI